MAKLRFATAAAVFLCSSSAVLAQFGPPPGSPPPPPPPAAPTREYASSQEQYDALLKAAHGGTKLSWTKMPDWSGVWSRETRNLFAFDEDAKRLPGGFTETTAQLTPKYRKAYEQKLADVRAGKEWDRLSDCLPAGFPRWLAEPWMREFIVTPNETWMSHEQINETRRIYTDGRGHVPEDKAIPLWMGDSVGFWDGDTLVVHTTHMKAGQYQRRNPDYSFHVSTVEQIRMIQPTLIEDQITVYDPDSLMKPWHTYFRYRKMPGDVRVTYAACEENNNTYRTADGFPNERISGEPGFRDGTKFGIPEVAYDSIPQ